MPNRHRHGRDLATVGRAHPRGDAQFLKMARGACAQALDPATFDVWSG